ncbi:Aureobasidin resistance protein Aur1 [Pichia californica]|uniref:Aureobasidin resistance protein Aur1 n=1 Tax=Pichia californica TaxID=460514 RepID=A0A9P7BER8_9ASCO|nr:Aureobasidin resistance protein Aur1 [[Candida] californica]
MMSLPEIIRQIIASFQSARQADNQLTAMETSFNPIPNLKNFPQNLKNATIGRIIFFSILIIDFIFSISIMHVSIIFKLLLIIILIYINFAPIFSQFFSNGLPILGWVFLFFNSKFIPLSLKRPISVKVLPVLETIFYGDNLSEILASKTNTFLDVFSWLPYGLIHFALPFIVAFLIFIFAPPQTLPQFCWSFGFMNLSGVIIQNIIFSCAPPWYKVLHGLEKANYSMKGSPGGLGRIDLLLGFDMYTSGFTNSPLIFGAMPSLHSGCSTMDALWLSYLLPKATPIWVMYVIWLWFSTMYLTHHYFIDVVVGSCLAVFFFSCVKWRGKLPINDKFCRWDYDSLNYHNIWQEDPLKISSNTELFDLHDYDDQSNSPYDLENQIPLNDLSNSSTSNNIISSTKVTEISNPISNNIKNNNKNKKSDVESGPTNNEDLDFFDSDDEIEPANDIEKAFNQTKKTKPKYFKESLEVTLNSSS